MESREQSYHAAIYPLEIVLDGLIRSNLFWGSNGAIGFSRFMARFLNKTDRARALEIRITVYLGASRHAEELVSKAGQGLWGFCWKVRGLWDALCATWYVWSLERMSSGASHMTHKQIGICVDVFKHIKRHRRALCYIDEVLCRPDIWLERRVEFLIDAAEIYDSMGTPETAEEFYRKATDEKPLNYMTKIRLHRSHGESLLRQGKKGAAKKHLTEALNIARLNFAYSQAEDLEILLRQV